MKLAALPLAIALTACGPTHIRALPPPPEYLECAPMPDAPTLPPPDVASAIQTLRDEMTLAYIVALRGVIAKDCGSIAGISEWAKAMR